MRINNTNKNAYKISYFIKIMMNEIFQHTENLNIILVDESKITNDKQ